MSGGPKVALVTGSSSGIGEATVKLFAEKGYRVAVCGSRKERVERVACECAKLNRHSDPLALVLDFRKAENGELAVRRTVEHFGRLDVLINNAGILKNTLYNGPGTYETYKETMDINVDAAVRASLAACGPLKKTNGCLMFTSSVGGSKPHADVYAYCMSKAALSMLAKCLAVDLAPHVRVNIVSPGPVKTELMEEAGMTADMMGSLLGSATLRGTVGECREVAALFYFLASDDSSFINGQEIFIDGGYSLKMFTAAHNEPK